MLPLLATLLALTPLAFGYTCSYHGNRYSTGNDFLIHSPNYPRTFPNGIQCDWDLEIPNAESITLECESFSLRVTPDCQNEYLQISVDGETFKDAVVYCGTGYLRHTVKTNVFKAHFGSKYRRHGHQSSSGFNCQLSYTEVPASSESDPAPENPENPKNPESSGNPETSDETCQCGIKNTEKNAGRIVGGDEASMNEYPWQCMLRSSNGYHFCGCSLINNEYILTASHCVVDGDTGKVTDPEDIIVSLGDHKKYTADETDKTVHIGVTSVTSHENYNTETTENDIAVLKLVQPVEFNDAINPICLPFNKQDMDMSGRNGTVAGWGTTFSGGDDSKMLLEVVMPMLNTKDCQSYLGEKYVTNDMICTYEEGKDACQGDSGGPLISDLSNNGEYYQVGVVSWGVGCGQKNFPGVYTKLVNYLDWILSNTDGNFCKK